MSPRARNATLLAVFLLGGCAASREAADATGRVEYDPFEPFNRTVYDINKAVDDVTLKQVAKAYQDILPAPVRRSVSNFSSNLTTPRSALNGFLQGKPANGISDITRFILNTTIGIGGLFDVATSAGLEQYDETFSQTLAVWGVPEGPYVYLPFFGPNSMLDAVTLPIDIMSDPLMHYDDRQTRFWLNAVRVVDLRARVLTAEGFLEDSVDPYLSIREAYLQNREYQIHDGDPPVDEDEFLNEFLDEEYPQDDR